MSNKHLQLGMNASTASGRLVKDLLYDFVCKSGMATCYRCGGSLSRSEFSIDHKEPWLHTENPVEMFFNIHNIAYSHARCNSAAMRPSNKVYANEDERKKAALIRNAKRRKDKYSKEERHNRWVTKQQ